MVALSLGIVLVLVGIIDELVVVEVKSIFRGVIIWEEDSILPVIVLVLESGIVALVSSGYVVGSPVLAALVFVGTADIFSG